MSYNRKKLSIDKVDIYLSKKELQGYFAESYFLLFEHLKYLIYDIDRLSKNKSKRKYYIDSLKNAQIQNSENIKGILKILYDNVELNAYSNFQKNNSNNTQITLKDFWYLRRDWCYTDSGEIQVNQVVDAIKKEISKINSPKETSLFLGCGVGRLSAEFADFFDKTYATDKSFSMIWHFQQLLNGKDVTFYDPQPKNVLKLENVAEKYNAKIPAEKLTSIENKIECFVSDVLDLPFKEESINSIFSIYFTDVIALKLWFGKINQVLSNNGLFIHFGPLDYFFSNQTEMLTAEEFRVFFEENGYKTIVDKVVETPHLEDSNSMSYRIYRNWFFVAQKINTQKTLISIDDKTVLKIENKLPFEKKGFLSAEGEHELDVILQLPSGNFNGASSVIQILKEIDSVRTYKQVLFSLANKGFDVSNKDQITDLLIGLVDQNVISIS